MVEIKECRYCGNCCYTRFDEHGHFNLDGCLFLNFDQKKPQFSCLIYANKARSAILISHLQGLFSQYPEKNQKSREYLSRELRCIKNNKYVSCCTTHECLKIMFYGEISVDIRTSEEHREAAILFQKKVEETRKVVPNFAGLVEELNVKVEQTSTKN